MKTASLLFALVLLAIDLSAAQQTRQMAAQKTGNGSFERYNLAAAVGDEPAVYYVSISLKGKLDVETATVQLDDGTMLPIIAKGVEKAHLSKFPWINAGLTRDQMQLATATGAILKVKSSKGESTFPIPSEQFAVMLSDADEHDTHRAKAELEKLISDFDPVLAASTSGGTSKITGQAFLKTRGGDVRVGAGNSILLLPDDEWTRRAAAMMKSGRAMDHLPVEISAYLARAIKTEQADAEGKFEFSGLAAGRYLLRTIITWEVPSVYRYGMEKTGGLVEAVALVEAGGSARVMLTR